VGRHRPPRAVSPNPGFPAPPSSWHNICTATEQHNRQSALTGQDSPPGRGRYTRSTAQRTICARHTSPAAGPPIRAHRPPRRAGAAPGMAAPPPRSGFWIDRRVSGSARLLPTLQDPPPTQQPARRMAASPDPGPSGAGSLPSHPLSGQHIPPGGPRPPPPPPRGTRRAAPRPEANTGTAHGKQTRRATKISGTIHMSGTPAPPCDGWGE
jgi:hypothetical protein